jgi:hypothetical protein
MSKDPSESSGVARALASRWLHWPELPEGMGMMGFSGGVLEWSSNLLGLEGIILLLYDDLDLVRAVAVMPAARATPSPTTYLPRITWR